MPDPKRTIRITFTGTPGSGKSSIMKAIAELLRYHGFEFTVEHDDTSFHPPTSEQIEHIATHTKLHLVEQHVKHDLVPAERAQRYTPRGIP